MGSKVLAAVLAVCVLALFALFSLQFTGFGSPLGMQVVAVADGATDGGTGYAISFPLGVYMCLIAMVVFLVLLFLSLKRAFGRKKESE
jgi:uncharacterized membrane protein